MKKLTLLFLALTLTAFAQTASDALTANKNAVTNSTIALTVTASQGDGSVCTITKLAGGQVNFSYLCNSADGKTTNRSGAVTSNSTVASPMSLMFGDILCLIVINPTAAAVTMGSVGPAPPKGIAWACTTWITGGGSTAITTGSVSWP